MLFKTPGKEHYNKEKNMITKTRSLRSAGEATAAVMDHQLLSLQQTGQRLCSH